MAYFLSKSLLCFFSGSKCLEGMLVMNFCGYVRIEGDRLKEACIGVQDLLVIDSGFLVDCC
jgi:hypothetical protein